MLSNPVEILLVMNDQTRKNWSTDEVQLIVADYFKMLDAELHKEEYKKSDHRKRLAQKLTDRSEGSIEFKHQNISAVMVELGLPYIEGYKPRGNYQALLATEVESYFDENKGLLQRFAAAPSINPTEPANIETTNWGKLFESPPDKIVFPHSVGKPWLERKPRRINFAKRDAANRKLGELSEGFVFELEQFRLNHLGRSDLASKVQWVSKDIGDGLGFDILSFDDKSDEERMIEVKATGLGKYFPFFVTDNELRCSEDIPDQFQLYRVFDFGKSPRLYVLNGPIRKVCTLDPVLYRALI